MHLPVDPSRYAAFLGVMAAMALAPGPANVFSIATGIEKGKHAALLAVAGLNTATLAWFAAAALGLGALVAAFPKFFYMLSFVGVLYIVYLAIKQFRIVIARQLAPMEKLKISKRSPFAGGFIVQITNPKALLFFTAVLPPFIDVERPIIAQLVMFALATFAMDGAAMTAYGLGGAALNKRAEDPRFRRGFALAVGVLMMTAAALIVADRID